MTASTAECELVGKIFERLGAIYGSQAVAKKFAGSAEAITGEWARGLRGLTAAELERGLDSCVTRAGGKFVPSLPEFRALCRPYTELYRYGLEQLALHYSARGTPRWMSPALFWAVERIRVDPDYADYDTIARRWRVEYDRAVAQELAGQLPPIPPRPTMIEHRETEAERAARIERNRANARRHMGAIKNMLGAVGLCHE